MPDFGTFECATCGDGFRALKGAQAASTGYCSPRCHSEGAGLA